MANLLSQEAIEKALSTRWLGRRVYYYPVVGSTNDILKELATRGEPAGTLLLADFQWKGRGRLGRRWQAPPGTALLFSLLFQPGWPGHKVSWLSMVGGLAIVEAIFQLTTLKAYLKWPNDIVLKREGRWHKVGGILLDGEFSDGELQNAILGIGINVNMSREELPDVSMPVTSLLIESGKSISRLELLRLLLQQLEIYYESAVAGVSPHLAWESLLITRGQAVQVSDPKSGLTIAGIAEGTDEWGRLLVRDDKGKVHPISAGDVTLRS